MVVTKTTQKRGTIFLTIFLIVILISVSTVATIFPYSFNVLAQESTYKIPPWIKTTTGFWVNGFSSDNEFVGAIEYLIKEGILQVPPTSSGSGGSTEIPSWIKSTAGYWVDGVSADNEFVGAIQFLIEEGILQVPGEDIDFFSKARESIENAIKTIQDNPLADVAVRSILPEIPVVGNLLLNLYDKSSGTTDETNAQILTVLEEYQKMDEQNLRQAFNILEENKGGIQKNTYHLEKLVSDTSLILASVLEINQRIQELSDNVEKRFDELKEEFGCEVEIIEKSEEEKAKQAMPGKVAILIE